MESKKQLSMETNMRNRINAVINRELACIESPIFVFVGVESYIDVNDFADKMVDPETFLVHANNSVFDQQWFAKVFPSLMTVRDYHILSLAQFTYLNTYLTPDYFKPKIVVVKDPLRILLPLDEKTVVEGGFESSVENERSNNLPEYMAELVKVGSDYYYSVRTPMEDFKTVSLFEDDADLTEAAQEEGYEVLDVMSDPYCLDLYINSCIKSNSFNKKVTVKMHEKNTNDKKEMSRLRIANALFKSFGGEVCEFVNTPVRRFIPNFDTLMLLRKYWGRGANFRDIKVYENPDRDKKMINISQGQIVQTIIDEYKKAKRGEKARDLFMTAPTGAGKSLLFQLPAFHVSGENDVTIVVSPLIGLMKEQVEDLANKRGFTRARYVNSELNFIQRERIIEECRNGEVDLLYMAPELLLSYDVTYFLGERKLGLLVVDEAHLISTWGRDFRVDYWFLGQYVNKIRKYHKFSFPMVAVTATAIYGGENDMVFETINSLCMNDPHIYIGEIKREDIMFVINNHGRYEDSYNAGKYDETANFVDGVNHLGIKTIVYAPYTRHIKDLNTIMNGMDCKDSVVSYYGSMNAEEKNHAYHIFKNNDAKIMMSTKAFGMGIDIPDIQLVYHHAPSGLLPDYVQEIGRAARNPEVRGFAALNYSMDDQRYSKMLHGMSSLKQYQIREILKRIVKKYHSNGRVRNMTFSIDDFSYIFSESADIEQKVMTALMMIEKDYLAKTRFNVTVARPKKMFGTVYIRVNDKGLDALEKKYSNHFKVIIKKEDQNILALDLEGLWRENFSAKSFPVVKSSFYKGNLFAGVGITPLVKVSYSLSSDYDEAYNIVKKVLDSVRRCLAGMGTEFFTADQLKSQLGGAVSDNVVEFILSAFSALVNEENVSPNPLLQRKRSTRTNGYEYRLLDRACSDIARLERLFVRLFESGNKVNRYWSGDTLKEGLHLGGLLTLLDLGEYETSGGDNPVVFIRINDPSRVQRDANYLGYTNKLLEKTLSRHSSSSELFDYFFMNSFDNETRWNFIEDYFLGASIEELKEKYPSTGEGNNVDILKFLKENADCSCNDGADDSNNNSGQNNGSNDQKDWSPRDKEVYGANRLLTINGETKTVEQWEASDPVALMDTVIKHEIYLCDNYNNLLRRLSRDNYEYLRDTLGLNLLIDFPGCSQQVKACIPYQDEPIKFYNWWKKNSDKVTMTKAEKVKLFLKVEELKPGTVRKTDLEIYYGSSRKSSSRR